MKTPRWRVVVLDDHPRSQTDLAHAVASAGGMVAGLSERAGEAVELVTRARPDAAIFAVGLRDGDGVGAARAVMEVAPCPIVLLTSHYGDDLIERARSAGVMGYLLKPLREEELSPTLDLAIARFGEVRLLRRRLEERKVIERAKGLLMARRGLSEDRAFRTLRRTAMNERRTMAEVAREVIESDTLTAGALG